jgi:hypothetical protein
VIVIGCPSVLRHLSGIDSERGEKAACANVAQSMHLPRVAASWPVPRIPVSRVPVTPLKPPARRAAKCAPLNPLPLAGHWISSSGLLRRVVHRFRADLRTPSLRLIRNPSDAWRQSSPAALESSPLPSRLPLVAFAIFATFATFHNYGSGSGMSRPLVKGSPGVRIREVAQLACPRVAAYPLMPLLVAPATNQRWKMMKKTASGAVVTTAMAITTGQSV